MALLLEDVNEFLLQNLPKCDIKPSGNKWVGRCPYCGDGKKNLHKKSFAVRFDDGENVYWGCWNCGLTGHFYELYAHIKGISVSEAITEFREFSTEHIRKQFNQKKPPKAKIEWAVEDLSNVLNDCITKDVDLESKRLLFVLGEFKTKRKISIDYPIFVCGKGKYKNRFIIPVYQNDKIVFFQARAIDDNISPKYISPETEKSCVILNKEHFDRSKHIIITEGLLDAMSVEYHQGTTFLGSDISDEFLEKIMTMTDSGVILAFDNPFVDETGKIKLLKFIENNKYVDNVEYFIMPIEYRQLKDLNDIKSKTNIKNIYKFVVENSYNAFKTKVLLKVSSK